MQWMSVRDAAERLGVTGARVRQLAAAGELAAHRHAAGWLIDRDGVEARRAVPRRPGRPIEPDSAWVVLNVLADASRTLLDQDLNADDRRGVARALLALRNDAVHGRQLSGSGRALSELVRDHVPPGATLDPLSGLDQAKARSLRRRLRHALGAAPAPERWSTWLAGRSRRRRYWAHRGVVDRLREDDRLSLGGAWAAALAGADIAPGDEVEAYVREGDLDSVVRAYRLREDPDGRVVLREIPSSVPPALVPLAGQPAAPIVVALDLHESPDTRSRRVALSWLAEIESVLSKDDGDPNPRADGLRKVGAL